MKIKPQESWDNSGLQVGSLNNDIKNIMLTLDLSYESAEYAANNNIDLIITHHPLLFHPIKSIDYGTYEGKIIRKLITHDINLYSMHTSFDMAELGVGSKLAEKLGIEKYDVLHDVNEDNSGYGGIGYIKQKNIIEYAKNVKDMLNTEHVKLYCEDQGRIISRVAFCGGSGSEFIEDAINKGADVYITGDIKYHNAQKAIQNNLCIIDAGHYYTEYHSLENIEEVLKKVKEIKVTLFEHNNVKELVI